MISVWSWAKKNRLWSHSEVKIKLSFDLSEVKIRSKLWSHSEVEIKNKLWSPLKSRSKISSDLSWKSRSKISSDLNWKSRSKIIVEIRFLNSCGYSNKTKYILNVTQTNSIKFNILKINSFLIDACVSLNLFNSFVILFFQYPC